MDSAGYFIKGILDSRLMTYMASCDVVSPLDSPYCTIWTNG